MNEKQVTIGTRNSKLAIWQANHTRQLLHGTWPELKTTLAIIPTHNGSAPGIFTSALEKSLLTGQIDLAVHSLKDLPIRMADGLLLGAVPERGSAADVLISRAGGRLNELAPGAIVGSSSPRRAFQLRNMRPDLRVLAIRGNVPTRLRLLDEGRYDALLLAEAGLQRLKLEERITERFISDRMLPAPGQGALAIQCRDEPRMRELLALIEHAASRTAVDAERAFLAALDGGCQSAAGALAELENNCLRLRARLPGETDTPALDAEIAGAPAEAVALGQCLAAQLLRAQSQQR